MQGLNLSQFKKLKEDKKMVTMGHPSGHSITILKSKVSPFQKKQLEALPIHLADGGDTTQDAAPPPATPSPPADDNSYPGSPVPTPISFSLPAPPGNIDPQGQYGAGPPQPPPAIPSADPNELPSASNDLPGMGQPVGSGSAQIDTGSSNRQTASTTSSGGLNVMGAYNQGQRAIDETKNVSAQLATSQADIQQNYLDASKAFGDSIQQHAQAFQDQQKAVLDDYMKGHIDPNQYEEKMGTTQKVATAIGLLLGGFSGGYNKSGVNPAADWLNAQIGRNIEAQKAKQDQQKTLLGANQALYHDQLLTDNATKAQMNDFYDHQIQLAATKLGTPQAQAIADAQHSKFALENAGLLQQNAIRASVFGAINGNGGAGISPLTLGHPAVGLMSPEQAQKEQASVDQQRATIAEIHDIYSQAAKLGPEAKIPYTAAAATLANLNARAADLQLRSDKISRLNPEVQKTFIAPSQIDLGDLVRTSGNQNTLAIKENQLLAKMQGLSAGDTPVTSKYAPAAVPNWGVVNAPAQQAQPSYRVGDIVYKNGAKGQVLADGRIKAVK